MPPESAARPFTVLGTPHSSDGSGWYRYYLPFRKVARHTDFDILLPPPGQQFVPEADDQLDQIDVLSAQRFLNIKLWESWVGKVALVYETDDDILHPDQTNGLPHMFDPDIQAGFRRCIEVADLVTVSTEPLADVMSEVNPNVLVLPNHVDADLLYLQRRRRDRVTVGWSGGMSHMGDWAPYADSVSGVIDAHPDVDLHFVGWDYSPMLRRKARYTPWKPNVWDFYKGIDFDIGLAPLEDTTFNRSKSHIRALEYAALGIPVIASDLPTYNRFVIDGVTGFLVSTPEEWTARLTELINDEAMRDEMGAKAKDRAAEFVIQTGWRLWADAFKEAAK